MTVYRHYAVSVLCNDFPVRVHAERPYHIIVFISLVHDLAFVYIVCYVLEYLCRQLDSDAYVHAVFLLFDAKFIAYLRTPFRSGTACRHHEIFTSVLLALVRRKQERAVVLYVDIFDRRIKFGFYPFAAVIEDLAEDSDIPVSSQMSYLRFKKVQVVSERYGLELGACRRVKSGVCTAHAAEHFVHVFHQFHSLVHTYIIVQISAELCRYVVFSVRKSTRPSVSVHYVARRTFQTVLCACLDRTLALFKNRTFIYHQYPGISIESGQLI